MQINWIQWIKSDEIRANSGDEVVGKTNFQAELRGSCDIFLIQESASLLHTNKLTAGIAP